MTDETLSLTYLALAVAALLTGPVVGFVVDRRPSLLPALNGFLFGSIGCLALFFLLPEAVAEAGGWAIGAAALGLGLLTLMERVARIEPERAHVLGRIVAVAGLLLHTTLDGVAANHGGESELLGATVVLHRVPAAIAIWWMVAPKHGRRVGAVVLLVAALATVAGFLVGETALAALDNRGAAIFQALVAGTLLHVLFHGGIEARGGQTPPSAPGRVGPALGLVAGVAIGAVLPATLGAHTAELAAYGARLLDLGLDTAPAVLLGYLAAGAVVVLLPRASMAWLARGGSLSQALRGAAFGVPIPICSCGVVPLYRSLVDRGAPAAAGLAFLVATPELGIESLFLSLPLLGGELTAARIVAAVLVAVTIGSVVGRLVPTTVRSPAAEAADTLPPGVGAKVRAALRYGFVDVVSDTGAWILAGLAVAAAVDASSLSGALAVIPPGVDVAFAAILGLPLYVCASGATPLAAALLFAGLSPGAAIAFLLAGPATNVTTYGLLASLHGRRVAVSFGVGMVVLATLCGVVVNVLIGIPSTGAALGGHAMPHGALAWMSLGAVGIAYVAALYRDGPQGFLGPVLSFGDHDDHGGHHHHGHAHDDHAHDDHDHGADSAGGRHSGDHTNAEKSCCH